MEHASDIYRTYGTLEISELYRAEPYNTLEVSASPTLESQRQPEKTQKKGRFAMLAPNNFLSNNLSVRTLSPTPTEQKRKRRYSISNKLAPEQNEKIKIMSRNTLTEETFENQEKNTLDDSLNIPRMQENLYKVHFEKPSLFDANVNQTPVRKELLFVRNIFNIDRERDNNKLEKDYDKFREELLKENKIIINELASYLWFMTTKEFIIALQEHFEETENEERKFDCLIMLQKCLQMHKFNSSDYQDKETLKALEGFIYKLASHYGEEIKKIRFLLKEIQEYNKSKPSEKNKGLQLSFKFRISDSFKPSFLAQELLALAVSLQNKLNRDILIKKEREILRDNIYAVSGNITEYVYNDLSKAVTKEDRLRNFNFYSKLSQECTNKKDLFSCMSLAEAFHKYSNSNEGKKILKKKKYKALKKSIDRFYNFALCPEGARERTNLLKDKEAPIFFPNFFKDLDKLGEVNPYLEGKENVIDSLFASAVGKLLGDLIERQQVTAKIKAATNLRSFLIKV